MLVNVHRRSTGDKDAFSPHLIGAEMSFDLVGI